MNPVNQFQRLLELQEQGSWASLEERCSELLQQPLLPPQRALVLQLKAQACLTSGAREQATELLEQAMGLLFLPQTALQWLALAIPDWTWQLSEDEWIDTTPTWVAICQQLVDQGYGELLLKSLMGLIAQLPLQGQRGELVMAIDRFDALRTHSHPQLLRQWTLVKQAAPSGGDGYWS
jgi:hypothetical protein